MYRDIYIYMSYAFILIIYLHPYISTYIWIYQNKFIYIHYKYYSFTQTTVDTFKYTYLSGYTCILIKHWHTDKASSGNISVCTCVCAFWWLPTRLWKCWSYMCNV